MGKFGKCYAVEDLKEGSRHLVFWGKGPAFPGTCNGNLNKENHSGQTIIRLRIKPCNSHIVYSLQRQILVHQSDRFVNLSKEYRKVSIGLNCTSHFLVTWLITVRASSPGVYSVVVVLARLVTVCFTQQNVKAVVPVKEQSVRCAAIDYVLYWAQKVEVLQLPPCRSRGGEEI